MLLNSRLNFEGKSARTSVMIKAVQRVKDLTKPIESDRPEAQRVDLKSLVGRILVPFSLNPNSQFG